MNGKVIGISLGILGAAAIATYFILNRKQTPTMPGTAPSPSPKSGPKPPSPAPTPTKTLNQVVGKFIYGNEVYATRFTNLYMSPVFSVTNVIGAFNQGDLIGTFAGKDDTGSFVIVNTSSGPNYVNANDVY